MIINSLLPPICIHSTVDNQWYIVTTDSALGWVKVDRKYGWEELNNMWRRVTYGITQKISPNFVIATYRVEGNKGNVYTIVNDGVGWNCNCPAYGFGRGRECKHIKNIKNN